MRLAESTYVWGTTLVFILVLVLTRGREGELCGHTLGHLQEAAGTAVSMGPPTPRCEGMPGPPPVPSQPSPTCGKAVPCSPPLWSGQCVPLSSAPGSNTSPCLYFLGQFWSSCFSPTPKNLRTFSSRGLSLLEWAFAVLGVVIQQVNGDNAGLSWKCEM